MTHKKAIRAVAVFILLLAVAFAVLLFGYRRYIDVRYPVKFEEQIYAACEEYDLEPALMFAVVNCESSFRPDARSHVNALGLTQVTPETFDWVKWRLDDKRDITHESLTDPEIALEYGAYLLSYHLKNFYHIENMLCAYHAGAGVTSKWLKNEEYTQVVDGHPKVVNIPYADTAQYVDRVMRTLEVYRKQLKG